MANTATEVLQHEHKIILLVMEGAARQVSNLKDRGEMDATRLYRVVDFCQNFIDLCHHGKEEAHLFAALQKKGLKGDHGTLIGVLLQEHAEARQKLQDLAVALPAAATGDAQARVRLANHLGAYRSLLLEHIDKENTVLFPLADQALDAEEQRTLLAAFDEYEARVMGAGVHEKYHRLAHELAQD